MKIWGSCAVLVSALWLGISYQRDKHRRIECLRGLCDSIQLLSGELSTRRVPLPELIDFCAVHTKAAPQRFYQCLALAVSQIGDKSFSALWEDAAFACLAELTEEELFELTSLGRTLGRVELSRQLAALEACRHFLTERLRCAEEQYRSGQKLAFGLPISFGALLIILLL